MCQGKPTKKVGEPDRDVLLCQALEKTEIRSSVIRCEDSAIMSQNCEIILVLSSPNVKDSQGVEKSVQVLPQTIRAENLPSVFTQAAVKKMADKEFHSLRYWRKEEVQLQVKLQTIKNNMRKV